MVGRRDEEEKQEQSSNDDETRAKEEGLLCSSKHERDIHKHTHLLIIDQSCF